MEKLKKLVLLHSNDMHGDFLGEKIGEKELGGISMLSGYIKKVKNEEPNVLYCISGDMLQGSLIDTEFRGLSTIEIMNSLNPDIVTLGNHEIDYGLGHLLLLERCAKFPIVNANLFIKNPYTRLFQSHEIFHVDGMKIMFIGIITSEVLSPLKQDVILGSLVDVEDAAREVGKICNSYRTVDIDFTVVLTHIGFEEDKELAKLLDPEWGVDVIIGGHSHTVLEQPAEINGILVTQAGVGTDQIGRFDIVVNMDTNSVATYKWELIPIDDTHCPRDESIEQTIVRFKNVTDEKYNQVLCWLPKEITHPSRYMETEIGDLLTDIVKKALQLDIMMIGSGSIRKPKIGPVITRENLIELFPYDDTVIRVKVSGKQFKKMYKFMLRDEALTGGHTEFYQYSDGLEVEYDFNTKEFIRFDFNGKPIDEKAIYNVGIQGYHIANFDEFFGLPLAEVEKNSKQVTLSTSSRDIIEEALLTAKKIKIKPLKRLKVRK